MKRILAIFLGLLPLILQTSCKEEDISREIDENAQKETYYINVKLHDIDGSSTRAGDDVTYNYGTDAERKVTDARFFFFGPTGELMTIAALYEDSDEMYGHYQGTHSDDEWGEDGDNSIEEEASVMLQVDGLDRSNLPTQMVTVLNPPANLETVQSLSELMNRLESSYKGKNDNFTMTTSSYKYDGCDNTNYCITPLSNSHFQTKESVSNPVDVYVERIAAKVEVALNYNSLNSGVFVELDAMPTIVLENQTIEGDGTYDLSVELLGWGLNATTPQTYLMKHIDLSWADNKLVNVTWNDAANHRSYWGMSYNYGLKDGYYYPMQYEEGKDFSLNYLSANDIYQDNQPKLGGFRVGNSSFNGLYPNLYCNENTNTGSIISINRHSVATCALVLAQLRKDGGSVGDIVRYLKTFYTEQAFVEKMYNDLKGTLANYTADGASVSISDLEMVRSENLNAKVTVHLNAQGASKSWKDADGNEVTAASINQLFDDTINAGLLTDTENEAVMYRDGLMYYSIPIEHYNKTADTQNTISEGHYGVVRNHYYRLTINSITGPGHGIDDPEEPIVPSPDNSFSIGASSAVLPWQKISWQLYWTNDD